MRHLSRRRFLTITAAATALPSMAPAASATWRGVALGAPASMQVHGLNNTDAQGLFAEIEAELSRLENIFSLYRPDSEISRLNRDGFVDAPSAELLSVLSLCRSLHWASDGQFDPTVQPLWLALATGADAAQIGRAQGAVGFDRLQFDAGRAYFQAGDAAVPPALTLNGIAQGAITDRVAGLMRARGLKNTLIDIGEIAALGRRPDGAPWRVGVAAPQGAIVKTMSLSDRAIATSSTHAPTPGLMGNHIIDPRNPGGTAAVTVAVSAPSAALADGLSTALCVVPEPASRGLLAAFADAELALRQA